MKLKKEKVVKITTLIGKGVASEGIETVLGTLIYAASILDEIDGKIELLLGEPFESAGRAFELAQVHQMKGESTERDDELRRARVLFDKAASYSSKGLGQVHALYLAGLCCDLLREKTKKEFYYSKPIDAIDTFKSTEKNKHVMVATLTGGLLVWLVVAP